ncbi:MAG: uncharacterized protein JWM36_4375 [Hyphomicrobiales bacterium]|nr:uncharacterized protein [Hyphomicrobiales bacterium]
MTARAAFFPGDIIDLLCPTPQDIRFSEIATRLSRVHRFAGGTREQYTQAQHSVRLMELCSKSAAPYALLHDAHKAFTGDVIKPFLDALDTKIGVDEGGLSRLGLAFEWVIRGIDRALWSAAGLAPVLPPAIADEIAAMSAALAGHEVRLFVGADPHDLGMNELLSCARMQIWDQARARREWLNAFAFTTGIRVE